MIARLLTACAGLACLCGAAWTSPPNPAAMSEAAARLIRPAMLPFAFRDLDAATRNGAGDEAFVRARRILRLLPGWTDGHIVFAYRYALTIDPGLPAARRGAVAENRMITALAWLDAARAEAGRREVELLQSMAMLPTVAATNTPELEALLRDAGGAAGIADHYLALAEPLSHGHWLRQQRTFLTPQVAAGLLAAGDRRHADAVLAAGIARAADVPDRALATEWAQRLEEVRRHLAGEAVDLTAVRADARMAPLLPHLR